MTLRLRGGLPSMRTPRCYRVLERAFRAGKERNGLRLVHFIVMSNHLHLLVDVDNTKALSRGMQGLSVRMAKRLNRLWGRKGAVWAERYHDRILRHARQVRDALLYVLNNSRHHGERQVEPIPCPYSSGAWFDGWRDYRAPPEEAERCPLAAARTFLQRRLWRRHRLLHTRESPKGIR